MSDSSGVGTKAAVLADRVHVRYQSERASRMTPGFWPEQVSDGMEFPSTEMGKSANRASSR